MKPALLRSARVLVLAVAAPLGAQEVALTSLLTVEVGWRGDPVAGASVQVGAQRRITDSRGAAVLELPAGDHEVVVEAPGRLPSIRRARVAAGAPLRLGVELAPLQEEIVVTATRSNTRLQDQPLRVEVVDAEEIREKALMTPGSVAMLLAEMPGLRVQTTGPSIGAAGLRIQGLPGHDSLLLSDGLPVYGAQGDFFSLAQLTPVGLAQVEVIKGPASALYGPGGLGGVINLVPRRPDRARSEVLINSSSLGATDAVGWMGRPGSWSWSFLGGAHGQLRRDIDGDGWTDVAGYGRGELRPRLFFDDARGRTVHATAGFLGENREGGTVPEGLAPDGQPFAEKLSTRHFDLGFLARTVRRSGHVASARASLRRSSQDRLFGTARERGVSLTWLAEASLQGQGGRHTWVAGAVLQDDRYTAQDRSAFDYDFFAPAVFVQDELAWSPRLSLAASARLDLHSEYGALASPRLSLLARPSAGFTVRVSAGGGTFAPTPFLEETAETGFSRLAPLVGLRAERGLGASLDASYRAGPFEVSATLFGATVKHPARVRDAGSTGVELVNAGEPNRSWGTELVARYRKPGFLAMLTHGWTRATGLDVNEGLRREVPLTPRQVASLNTIWEGERWGRLGLEVYVIGRQALDRDPYLAEGRSHVLLGLLGERPFGRVRVFLNLENLLDVRQTKDAPLVRPARLPSGSWTVGAWAPLDGRTVNGGLRVVF